MKLANGVIHVWFPLAFYCQSLSRDGPGKSLRSIIESTEPHRLSQSPRIGGKEQAHPGFSSFETGPCNGQEAGISSKGMHLFSPLTKPLRSLPSVSNWARDCAPHPRMGSRLTSHPLSQMQQVVNFHPSGTPLPRWGAA